LRCWARWFWRAAKIPIEGLLRCALGATVFNVLGQQVPGGVVVPTSYYLVLSAVLFGLGVVAFIFKRNIITIFMSIELMLNAVNLAFVAFSRALGQLQGQVFVFFVIVVAAAEAAVGLAIIIVIARNRGTLNVERVDSLKH
jgi:NADH-quinone oxidoreductase subunit K